MSFRVSHRRPQGYILLSLQAGGRNRPRILPKEIFSFVRYCDAKALPLLPGCDINAHNKIWGPTGEIKNILEYTISNRLKVQAGGPRHNPRKYTYP